MPVPDMVCMEAVKMKKEQGIVLVYLRLGAKSYGPAEVEELVFYQTSTWIHLQNFGNQLKVVTTPLIPMLPQQCRFQWQFSHADQCRWKHMPKVKIRNLWRNSTAETSSELLPQKPNLPSSVLLCLYQISWWWNRSSHEHKANKQQYCPARKILVGKNIS